MFDLNSFLNITRCLKMTLQLSVFSLMEFLLEKLFIYKSTCIKVFIRFFIKIIHIHSILKLINFSQIVKFIISIKLLKISNIFI